MVPFEENWIVTIMIGSSRMMMMLGRVSVFLFRQDAFAIPQPSLIVWFGLVDCFQK